MTHSSRVWQLLRSAYLVGARTCHADTCRLTNHLAKGSTELRPRLLPHKPVPVPIQRNDPAGYRGVVNKQMVPNHVGGSSQSPFAVGNQRNCWHPNSVPYRFSPVDRELPESLQAVCQ